MRPGCIFVSSRSILICGWFAFFFECLCKYCRHGWVFPSLVIFWMLYFFFLFSFFSEKSCISCFSEALLLVTRIWWVEGLSFHTKFYCKVAEVNSVRTVDDVKLFYWFACEVGCVRVCVCVCVCVSLQYNEDTHSSVHQQAWSLQCSPLLPPPTSSVCPVYFYSHHLLLTVILNSLNLPFQHAQSKDIFPHLCIVSEVLVYIFYDMRYIILMVNGYISWICKSIWWLCTVHIKAMGL